MGQLFNLSKVCALEDMMTGKVAEFVGILKEQIARPVEVIRACRALEADIICRFLSDAGA
jgi:hypothetical protein